MKRTLLLSTAVLLGLLGWTSVSEAQVFIRAPFVRIAVGDGVAVRAPFVNLYVPPAGPVYYPAPDPYYYGRPIFQTAPPPIIVPQQQPQPQPMPPAQEAYVPPAPQPVPQPAPVPVPQAVDPNAPPTPLQPVQAMTIDAFAKSFQAKAGAYDVTLLNPITKQPTRVRFNLPEGTPRRVIVDRNEIEFFYGLRHFVRIEFDREGAIVTSR